MPIRLHLWALALTAACAIAITAMPSAATADGKGSPVSGGVVQGPTADLHIRSPFALSGSEARISAMNDGPDAVANAVLDITVTPGATLQEIPRPDATECEQLNPTHFSCALPPNCGPYCEILADVAVIPSGSVLSSGVVTLTAHVEAPLSTDPNPANNTHQERFLFSPSRSTAPSHVPW